MGATSIPKVLISVLFVLIPCLIYFQLDCFQTVEPQRLRFDKIPFEDLPPVITTPKPTVPPTKKVTSPPTSKPVVNQDTASNHKNHIASKALASSIQRLLAKDGANGNIIADIGKLEEEQNDVNSYSADHEFLLVLFSTEDGIMRPTLQNVLYMFNLFQKHFNCRCILFTSTEEIINRCKELDIVVGNATVNEYGLPYIGDMYKSAAKMFKSSFYGYINADILVSTEIFPLLEHMKTVHEQQYPNKLIELCHNSWISYPPRFSNALSLYTYNRDFKEARSINKGQRGVSSVDMFILSNNFMDIAFKPIVVARARIDAYMIYMAISNQGIVFDTGDAAPTVHQGVERYTKRARRKVPEDFNWNQNVLKGAFADLNSASGVIKKTNDGYTIERKANIVRKKRL